MIKRSGTTSTHSDRIDSWTFGMITNGKKVEQIARILESIRNLNVPHYEIIICGTYNEPIKKDTRYIPFSENDDKGWITRKKNLIAEHAKYENMVIFHDRILFNPDWYEGMKRYGNNFDVLSCRITSTDGRRAHDWLTQLYPYEDIRHRWLMGGYLDYDATDPWVYVDGGLIIIKRSVWARAKWDETLFWNEEEDYKLSSDQHRLGIKIEFNKYSSCTTLSFNHPQSRLLLKKTKSGKLRLTGPFYIIIGKRLMNAWSAVKYVVHRIVHGKPVDFRWPEGEDV